MSRTEASPVLIRTDRVMRHHYKFSSSAPVAERRFDSFRSYVANFSAPQPPSDALLLASVLAFGLVGREDVLERYYGSLADPMRWGKHVVIHWSGPGGRHNLRSLSPLMVAALLHLPRPPFAEARNAFAEWALRIPAYHGHSAASIVTTILGDACAWAVAHLPGVLARRVVDPSAAADVPPSCLAREQRRLPLASTATSDMDALRLQRDILLREPSAQPADWDDIKHRVSRAIGAAAERPEWVRRRAAIEAIGRIVDSTTALSEQQLRVLAFAVDLVARGTLLSGQLALSTCYDYWCASADALLVASERLPHASERDDLLGLYATLMNDGQPGAVEKLSACLRAHHDFMAELLDLPELQGPIAAAIFQDAAPRANVFWPHEQRLLSEHFERLGKSGRFGQQLRCLDELLRHTGRRIGELLTLPMGAFRLMRGEINEIFIEALPCHDRVKTPAGTGHLSDFTRPLSATARWLARRRQEGARSRDLLFGSSGERGVWREGATRLALLSAYRTVTGDAAVNLHTARHSFISFSLNQASFDAAGERDVAQMTASRGHESASTSLSHYDHLGFLALAAQAERLEAQLPLSSRALARWIGTSGPALRKAASRSSTEVQTLGWQRLRQLSQIAPCPPIDARFAFGEVAFGDDERHPSQPLTTTLAIVRQLLADMSPEQAAEAVGEPIERVERIALTAARMRGATAPLDDAILAAPGYWMRRLKVTPQHPDDMDGAVRGKAALLYRWACRTEPAKVAEAVASWRNILVGGYWSLERPERAVPLLTALREAGYQPSALQVRLAPRAASELDASASLERRVVECMRSIFGTGLPIQRLAPRRGRPRVYLQVSQGSTASRSLCMDSLNTLMFVAALHLQATESSAP